MTTRYVNTASSAGGDGTTNNTTGATRAFATLLEAINSLPATLTDAYTIYCEGSAADTSALSQTPFDFTTTAANYVLITVAAGNRHDGKWNTSKYRLEVTNTNALYNNVSEHIRVEWLQIQVTVNDGNSYVAFKTTNANQTGSAIDMRGSNLIIKGVVSGVGSALTGLNARPTTGGSGTSKMWNCLVYDCTSGISSDLVGAEFYNCTLVANKYGAVADGTNQILKNCLSKNTDFDYVGGGNFGASCTNNASADTTAPGSNARTSQTFTFINEGADDYHLAATDAGAKDFGVTDPASGLFSDDIDGTTRSGSWDIGADEYIESTPPPIIRRVTTTRRRLSRTRRAA